MGDKLPMPPSAGGQTQPGQAQKHQRARLGNRIDFVAINSATFCHVLLGKMTAS